MHSRQYLSADDFLLDRGDADGAPALAATLADPDARIAIVAPDPAADLARAAGMGAFVMGR